MASLKISVIIPCYKQGHLVAEAIDSVLTQTYPHVEVVLVDDGSPDSTGEVAARYGDRIRYIRKENAGLSAARNTGILHSTGDFIQFLDADDYLLPSTFERHIATVESVPDGVVFYGTYFLVDMEGKPFGPRFDPRLSADPTYEFLLGNYFPPHAAMTRRTAFAQSGLFDPHLQALADWDMWLRLAESGAKFVRTEEVAVPYRQCPASMSRNRETMRQEGVQLLDKSAAYRRRCARYRHGIAHGRWNVRYAFLDMTQQDVLASNRTWQSLQQRNRLICNALREDPLLALTGVRKSLRQLKWRLLETVSAASSS